MSGTREEQSELLDKLHEYYSASNDLILDYVLGWLSSDDACCALRSLLEEYEDGNR